MTREEAIEVYNGLINEKIKEAFEFFAPELAGSEDEKIRKGLIDIFNSALGQDFLQKKAGLNRDKVIAYLKKQKEQTENATKTLAKILKDSAEGFRRILKKKGIDYEVSDKFWENTAVVYSKEEDVEFHKWMDDLMGPTPIEETYGFKKGLEAGIKQKEQKPWKVGANAYFTPEQKPTENNDCPEWVKQYNNEYMLNTVLSNYHLHAEVLKKQGDTEGYKLEKSIEDWLRNVVQPLILKEHKPAEWSEEDEEMINDIIYCLPKMAMGNIEMLPSVAEQYANRLKSLRPRRRPSEEQMEALESAVKLYKDTHFEIHHEKIVSLYEQLKAL